MSYSKTDNIRDGIKITIKAVLGLILSLCFVPLVLIVYTCFFLLSRCSLALIKLRYGWTATLVRGNDALCSKKTSDNSALVINSVLRYNGKLTVQNIKNRILKVIHASDKAGNKKYERLLQVYQICYGYNAWITPEQFRIEDHFRVLDINNLLSVGEGEIQSGQEWESLVTKVLNKCEEKQMKEGIPQWEFLFLKESNIRYTIFFRINHSIADGIYISRLICEMFTDEQPKLVHIYTAPTAVQRIYKNFLSFCFLPFGLAKVLFNKDKNVWHGTKLSGEKRHYISKPFSMKIIKEIRVKVGVSVNAILFTCGSYAFETLFNRRDTRTKSITSLLPLPLQDLQKPIMLKNRFSVVCLKLPTDPSSFKSNTPLERLKQIQPLVHRVKTDPIFYSTHSLLTTFCAVLPNCLVKYLVRTKGCTFLMSNMPGPQEESWNFEKHKLEDTMFWLPNVPPLGVSMSVLSYNNQMRVGLLIDKSLMNGEEEGDEFLSDIVKELQNIIKIIRKTETIQENKILMKEMP